MANFIERKLPQGLRNNFKVLIASGLGIFIGLRYNEYLKLLLETYFPNDDLVFRFIILVVLTIAVAYAALFLEKALDGR